MLSGMPVAPAETPPGTPGPGEGPGRPALPPLRRQVWPVVVVGFLGWLVAAAAAFGVPALQSWRPVTLAGLGTGLLGASIVVLQLAAARRGARGAQSGLEN